MGAPVGSLQLRSRRHPEGGREVDDRFVEVADSIRQRQDVGIAPGRLAKPERRKLGHPVLADWGRCHPHPRRICVGGGDAPQLAQIGDTLSQADLRFGRFGTDPGDVVPAEQGR